MASPTEQDVLHRGSLRSAVELDQPAGTAFDLSFYEFAMHRIAWSDELKTWEWPGKSKP